MVTSSTDAAILVTSVTVNLVEMQEAIEAAMPNQSDTSLSLRADSLSRPTAKRDIGL